MPEKSPASAGLFAFLNTGDVVSRSIGAAYRHKPGCSAADRGRGGSQSGRGTSPDWRARDERQMTTPRDIGLVSFNRDVHPTEAMDEIGAHAFHFARDMHTHAPRMHFFKQHAQLQFSQACADATVNAMAE